MIQFIDSIPWARCASGNVLSLGTQNWPNWVHLEGMPMATKFYEFLGLFCDILFWPG